MRLYGGLYRLGRVIELIPHIVVAVPSQGRQLTTVRFHHHIVDIIIDIIIVVVIDIVINNTSMHSITLHTVVNAIAITTVSDAVATTSLGTKINKQTVNKIIKS